MLSATILPGGISQAVGNAFPIFGNMLPGKCGVSMPAILQARFALSMCF